MNTTTQWQIPFFVKLPEQQFIEEIRALGFYQSAQNDLIWQGGDAAISLKPLRTNGGNLSSGYRFNYEGNQVNDCLAVLKLILTMYPSSYVTGIECCIEGTNREQIMRQAVKNNFSCGEMYGIYQNDQVNVVCMPEKTVLQVRKKGLRKNHLEQIMRRIVATKEDLLDQTFNLFTLMPSDSEMMISCQ